MNFIGIDVSASKLNIHIIGTNSGDYEIKNTKVSIEKFIEEKCLNKGNYTVGAESTGRYHLVCQNIFVELGFEFRLINPILTNKKISTTIRKKKTDISDAQHIAKLIEQGEGQKISKEQLNTTKKSVLRTRNTVVKHRSSMKLIVQDLSRAKNDPQIEKAIETLNNLIENMDVCEKELEKNALNQASTEAESLIQTIPGFAQKLSAVVATEIGDFERFPSANELKAYVGIDPKVTQSGDMLKTGRITKRGNPHLRCAFYLAAQVARIHDPDLKEFYEKKIGEGKHFRVAICAVARKLCERVYAVVTKGEPYKIRKLPSI